MESNKRSLNLLNGRLIEKIRKRFQVVRAVNVMNQGLTHE